MAEDLVARCECGFEVRGTDDEIVAGMGRHARDVHNMSVTREQVLERTRQS